MFHFPPEDEMNLLAPNVWTLTTRLVEHCSSNAEVTGSNPVETWQSFLGLNIK